GRTGDQGSGGTEEQGGQVGGHGNEGDVRNIIVNNDQRGCSYKEFLACNPKEYDEKGGAIVYTCWIEKIESVQDARSTNKAERPLLGCHGKTAGHAAYTNRFHELARLVPHLKAGKLTDEAVRNRPLKKNPKKRGIRGDPNRDKNARYKNKRTRTWNAFATTTNPDCRVAPRIVNPMNARNPTAAPRACYECRGTDHFKAACPRLNQA
ncbi:hypothetical protein Tco_1498269, partial [Tanacetum coccineum]